MAFSKFLTMAFRDLLRNGRRSALTALAVGLGLVVVMAFASLIDGMLTSVVADNVRMSTGHVQVRSASYEADQASLLAEDLLEDPEAWVAQAEALPEVQSAAPVLWSGGLLGTARESIGIQIMGLDPADPFHAPIREGIVAGQYLSSGDRGLVLLGRRLAQQMEIGVGDRVSLTASDADGRGQEGIFTVAGLVDTGFPSVDQGRVIMSLEQAQSFSSTGDRFSSLILMLNDENDAERVAALFATPETQVETWVEMNSLILDTVETGIFVYYILYGIVFLVVAVLIANTLLMSVFARAREIGILAALGMNRRQIMLLFLLEGLLLAVFGVALGWVLGLGLVSYMTFVGFTMPADTLEMVEGLAIGTTIRGGFAMGDFVVLSLFLLAVVALVSLYPAWFAARMEPVEALHTV